MKKIENSNFKRLIGVWKTSGTVKSGLENFTLSGVDTYEFMLDNNYILHKADVMIGEVKSETFEIIKLDDSHAKAIMQYFNSNGEDGCMCSTFINDAFTIEGKGLRFVGKMDKQSSTIRGKWYIQLQNDQWVEFIDLKLEK